MRAFLQGGNYKRIMAKQFWTKLPSANEHEKIEPHAAPQRWA